MTYDQIVRESELDEQDIVARLRYEWPLMRRKIIKARIPLVFHDFIYKTRQHNQYIVIAVVTKQQIKQTDPQATIINACVRDTAYGKEVTYVSTGDWERYNQNDHGHLRTDVTRGQKLVQTFSPHLISRYNERMGFNLTGMPLIRKFVMNDMINDGIDFDDESNLLVTVTRNGLLLGEAIGGDFFRQHYRTFITRRMIHETQVEKLLTMEALGFDVGEIPDNKLLSAENALHNVMLQPREVWERKEKTFLPNL